MNLIRRFIYDNKVESKPTKNYLLENLIMTIILVTGLVIAAITRNAGNLFIFIGLGSVTHSFFFEKFDITLLNLGRLFYIIGFVWSFFQGDMGAILGWSSVFATLFWGSLT